MLKNTVQNYCAGDVILSPFLGQGFVYTVQAGFVAALTYDEAGKKHVHLLYGSGCYFPVLTTYFDQEQRATYTAHTDTTLLKVKKQDFLQELKNNQDFSQKILLQTVRQLGIFADRVINLETPHAESRLESRLRSLSREHGKPTRNGTMLPYPLSHQDIADMIGVERETVSRLITKLKNRHILIVKNQIITVM